MIPQSHLDLLERPLLAALTTRLPDGSLQTQPVWFDLDGACVRINTMQGFRKELNMRTDPRVSLLVVDPARQCRWIEIRGRVALDSSNALAHLDGLARRYTGAAAYFGSCVPQTFAACERPVLGRISPTRVVTEGDANAQTLRTQKAVAPTDEAACSGPTAAIRDDHRDLLERALPTVVSTSMPDGQPQTQPVWADLDGTHVRIATARERQKARNLERDPRATVLVVDPDDGGRWIEIRARAELSAQGALAHIAEICRLHPMRVVYDAIHRPQEKRGGIVPTDI